MNLTGTDLTAAYYVTAEVVRHRQRTGQPIPQWLSRHFDRLGAEVRASRLGHESDRAAGQSQQDKMITTREVAAILGCSKRQAQRLAAELDGFFVGGRWLFKRNSVIEYAEGRHQRAV